MKQKVAIHSFYSTTTNQREHMSIGTMKKCQRELILKINLINLLRWMLLTTFCHLTMRTTLSIWMRECVGYLVTIEVLAFLSCVGIVTKFLNWKYQPPNYTSYSLSIISLLGECLLCSVLCKATRGDFIQFSFMMTLMELIKILFLACYKYEFQHRHVQIYYLILILIVPAFFYVVFSMNEMFSTCVWTLLIVFYNITYWGTALNLAMDFAWKLKDRPLEAEIVVHYFGMFFVYVAAGYYYLQKYTK